jgi:signal transduction histidine kinase
VYSPVAESEGKMLTSKIADGLGFIGDEELLVQMLANLVENAIKHTPPKANLRVELKKENQRSVTEVSDNGSGIPEKERKKVFERFYRLEQSRTTPGNGLGLALVAAIAELHSISVALEDNNPGLRVVMSFPDNEAH